MDAQPKKKENAIYFSFSDDCFPSLGKQAAYQRSKVAKLLPADQPGCCFQKPTQKFDSE